LATSKGLSGCSPADVASNGAIRELDFRPNRAARALSPGTSRTVTILTSNTTLYGRAAILHGVEEAARAAGFPVGAGIRALRAVPAGIPVVAALEVTDTQDRKRYPSVTLDDRTAAQNATRDLLDLGHQTVHHVAIPSSTDAGARMQGWRAALKAAGVEPPRSCATSLASAGPASSCSTTPWTQTRRSPPHSPRHES
jgi:DNA-binding LacI/PurR family transcriptional regulator